MDTVYVGTTEAAFLLQISAQRIRKLANDGRIEGAVKEGEQWKIPLFEGMPKITPQKRGPQGSWRKKPDKVVTFIHVSQDEIVRNSQNKTTNPVIIVRQEGKSKFCNEEEIPGLGRIIYHSQQGKDNGGKVSLEVDPDINIQILVEHFDQSGTEFQTCITFEASSSE